MGELNKNAKETIFNSVGGAWSADVPEESRLGTAKFLTVGQAEKQLAYKDGALWIGRSIGPSSVPLGYTDDKHVLLCAETRSGKSNRILVPTLAKYPGSALVLDTKGDLASIMADRRGPGNPQYCDGMGQTVRVLDPYGVANVRDSMRVSFNPLSLLKADDEELIDKAGLIANSLIPDEDMSGDRYWPEEGRQLLICLMIHVATYEDWDQPRTLNSVYQLLTCGDREVYESLTAAEKQEVLTPIQAMFLSMKANPVMEGYVKDRATFYSSLEQRAEKQWTGIQGAAARGLSWMSKPKMKRCLGETTFSFRELKQDPAGATVFISIPSDRLENENWRWVRLIVDIFMSEMRQSRAPANGHPVLALLDEFASLRRMKGIETGLREMAEYGVKMYCVVQNLNQLREVYRQKWGTFYSAAGLRIFFGVEDLEDMKFLSERIGKTEIVRHTRSINQGEGTSQAIGRSHGTSQAESKSVSQSESSSEQWSQADGTTHSQGYSIGGNSGHTWKATLFRDWFLGLTSLPVIGDIHGVKKDKQFNQGKNYSQNSNDGTSSTRTTGGGSQKTTSSQDGTTYTQNEQFTETDTTNRNWSVAISETIHTRELLPVNDIDKCFARIDNIEDPRYPGIALVMLHGGRHVPVRLCIYYEDNQFWRAYGKHPTHGFRQAPYPDHIVNDILKQEPKKLPFPTEQKKRKRLARLEQVYFMMKIDLDLWNHIYRLPERHRQSLERVEPTSLNIRAGDPIITLDGGAIILAAPVDCEYVLDQDTNDASQVKLRVQSHEIPRKVIDMATCNMPAGDEEFEAELGHFVATLETNALWQLKKLVTNHERALRHANEMRSLTEPVYEHRKNEVWVNARNETQNAHHMHAIGKLDQELPFLFGVIFSSLCAASYQTFIWLGIDMNDNTVAAFMVLIPMAVATCIAWVFMFHRNHHRKVLSEKLELIERKKINQLQMLEESYPDNHPFHW